MTAGVDVRGTGTVTVQEALAVRHQVSLPVLAVAGVALAVALLLVRDASGRFDLVGCRREVALCTVFDSATGQVGLVPLPIYPGEAKPRPNKQEV